MSPYCSCGGEGGIRTLGPLAGTPVFKTGAINRSATSPCVAFYSARSVPDELPTAHVLLQHLGHAYATVWFLVVLEHGDQRPSNGHA
jgi:hypothetical protein